MTAPSTVVADSSGGAAPVLASAPWLELGLRVRARVRSRARARVRFRPRVRVRPWVRVRARVQHLDLDDGDLGRSREI